MRRPEDMEMGVDGAVRRLELQRTRVRVRRKYDTQLLVYRLRSRHFRIHPIFFPLHLTLRSAPAGYHPLVNKRATDGAVTAITYPFRTL